MRYQFYTDGSGKTICLSSYAGKTVRGIAKCNPSDNYNEVTGKMLARARCDAKVANKRFRNAKKEYKKAYEDAYKAYVRLVEMDTYVTDAYQEAMDTERIVSEIISELGGCE